MVSCDLTPFGDVLSLVLMGQLTLLIITDHFNPSVCVRIKDLQWNIDLSYELVFPIKITYLSEHNFCTVLGIIMFECFIIHVFW